MTASDDTIEFIAKGRCVIVPPCAHICASISLSLGTYEATPSMVHFCSIFWRTSFICCIKIHFLHAHRTSIKEETKRTTKLIMSHLCVTKLQIHAARKKPVYVAYHSLLLKRKYYHHTAIQFVLPFFLFFSRCECLCNHLIAHTRTHFFLNFNFICFRD